MNLGDGFQLSTLEFSKVVTSDEGIAALLPTCAKASFLPDFGKRQKILFSSIKAGFSTDCFRRTLGRFQLSLERDLFCLSFSTEHPYSAFLKPNSLKSDTRDCI